MSAYQIENCPEVTPQSHSHRWHQFSQRPDPVVAINDTYRYDHNGTHVLFLDGHFKKYPDFGLPLNNGYKNWWWGDYGSSYSWFE